MRKLHATLLLLALLGTFAFTALADELADQDYVDSYFGTSVVFITGNQLVDPMQGYWGNLLPQEFMYSQGTLIKIINDVRQAAGNGDLLKPADYPIGVGAETKLEDGRWEYSIEFRGCTPSESQLVLDSVTLSGVLADCEREFRPLCVGYFYADAQNLGSIDLVMQDATATLTPDMTLADMLSEIKAVLQAKYGDNCQADIYISANDAITGGKAMYVNVTVYLDGAEKQFQYYGGMEYAEPYEG